MEQYSYEYRELYTECYNKLENNANSSVQSYLRNGLANLSENAGNVIAKIPVINKSRDLLMTGIFAITFPAFSLRFANPFRKYDCTEEFALFSSLL